MTDIDDKIRRNRKNLYRTESVLYSLGGGVTIAITVACAYDHAPWLAIIMSGLDLARRMLLESAVKWFMGDEVGKP